MIIYLLGFFMSLLFAFLYEKIVYSKRYNIKNETSTVYILGKYFKFLSFFPLFFLSAIRYDVGTDYLLRYVPAFERILRGGEETFEIGFILLNKFIQIFTDDYVWLFVITSFIFCYFIYKAIFEQSVDICYSISLLFFTSAYFMSLNLVRQCISIAIFLYSLKYIKERNFKKYVFFIFLAMMFHNSAFIYLPIYFLGKIRVKIIYHLKILVSIILLIPILKEFLIFIINQTKYFKYFGSIYDNSSFSFWGMTINIIILLICYMISKNRDIEKVENYNLVVNLQLVTVILLLFSSIIPHFDRIIINLTFIQIISLPLILNQIKNLLIRNTTKISFLVIYGTIMINKIVIHGNNEVLPYKTIFMIK